MALKEFELRASIQTISIGGVSVTNAEVYNGTLPGPTLGVEVGDDVVVRFVNDLPFASGIHWHGIELSNSMDGTPVTQDGVPGGDLQILAGEVTPVGGTYLYKFKVTRPGIFWYHPHHHHSTNRVFRGLYGMLIVRDATKEINLIGTNKIPDATNTYDLVLADTTICKLVNDTVNYVDPATIVPATNAPEWVRPFVGGGVNFQEDSPGVSASPARICTISPVDDDGVGGASPFGAGKIPNIQKSSGKIFEGQTVIVNGDTPEPRFGTPTNPVAITPTSSMLDVAPGQGIRLQAVNCSQARYFRLRLTYGNGTVPGAQVPLIRIGGEGGLLNTARQEGGMSGTYNTKYDSGEILLAPATRADFVFTVPVDAVGVMTLWTRDFSHKSSGFALIPTVPVKHFDVSLPAVATPYSIAHEDALLDSILGASISAIPATPDSFLDPRPIASGGDFLVDKSGSSIMDIQLTGGGSPGIDTVPAWASSTTPYTGAPFLLSSRFAEADKALELTVTNNTGTHHPFHLHGFSFQPKELTRIGFPTYTFGYQEYRDTVDIPGNYTLRLHLTTDDHKLCDGITDGGAMGRWLFHCHIFYHAHRGMLSELFITTADGGEKPNVDIGGSWTYAPSGGNAVRFGTYFHRDGLPITLTTTLGSITLLSPGNFRWDSGIVSDQTTYVYILATDSLGRVDQTVFRLQIGGTDDGSDNGDPHIKTIDGTRYDFQAVGEFTLLADRDGMEIQTRQTPVPTATPITNAYTGLKSCVSVNTAVAVRLGKHYISYQQDKDEGTLQFYLNGKPTDLTTRTITLDNNLVSGIDINGVMSLRVDFEHHAVLIATPHFWSSNNIHYLNISVSHTHGDEGLMGKIPKGDWLPKLKSGASLGPKPNGLQERYKQLYKTFADSWRVTKKSSLFTYVNGTSTDTFTDKDWPTFEPPCKLKPQFELPGATLLPAIAEADAKIICKAITEGDLFEDCVLDVSATGDKDFAEAYLIQQRIRHTATSTHVTCNPNEPGNQIKIIAVVLPLHKNGAKPKGKVTFYLNNEKIAPSVAVDSNGHAHIKIDRPKKVCNIKAEFENYENDKLAFSVSPALKIQTHQKDDDRNKKEGVFSSRLIWLLLIIIFLILLLILFFLM